MHFPPLDGTNPAMGIKDLVLRALYDADNSVQDVPVTVTGFIAPAGEGYADGYTIARMVISCCAADANPMQLHVAGDAPVPTNTWVDAVVTVQADTATMDNGYVPTVTVTSLTRAAAGRPVRALIPLRIIDRAGPANRHSPRGSDRRSPVSGRLDFRAPTYSLAARTSSCCLLRPWASASAWIC